ncbi:MAG: bifunctional demethylmenaquinone methyltransferase/2-methoxy-6-polyprenyl-1,4-benzoquinol methylase UbiE [Candidatus Acidiferrales bacterium]
MNFSGTGGEKSQPVKAPTPLPGTRPEGTHDEVEAARRVREMFTRIAPRYDFLNHLLSLSFDRPWRTRTARRFRHILERPGSRTLDLCCGTGDLTFALEREASRAGRGHAAIYGSDFVPPMLALARKKARRANRTATFLAADALSLPFPGNSFDLVTAAFGFRNLSNYDRGLREIFRVLRSGGELGILEFSEPRGKAIAPLFRFYFEKILPRIGNAISGNSTAYSYLPASVARFPQPEELSNWMARAGFSEVQFATWMTGAVVLHSARKPD